MMRRDAVVAPSVGVPRSSVDVVRMRTNRLIPRESAAPPELPAEGVPRVSTDGLARLERLAPSGVRLLRLESGESAWLRRAEGERRQAELERSRPGVSYAPGG
jgi:hypothetical protein